MSRVLVTGGAGFIGSTLVDRLLANLTEARAVREPEFTFHRIDVRTPEVAELIARRKPEVVFHLAAQMDVRVSVERPVFDAETNIIGSLQVLEGARQAGSRKVVFASSGGTIYGDPDPVELPVRETHPQQPLSPYGVAKKAVGDYLVAYRQLHDLEFTALALANVYGPRQNPHGEAGVVAIFCQRLAAGEPCTIYGDGSSTRDYVFVDDVVDAFARSGDAGDGLLLNVGTGVETNLRRLYDAVAHAVGTDAEPVYAPERPGELYRSCLDPGRAGVHLGWRPWTTLEQGISSTVASSNR